VVSLYSFFLQKERFRHIDQQVRETAAALVDSELGDLRKFDFDQADDIISEELGESRIGKFFIVRNAEGHILFESASVKVLPVRDIPRDDRWITLATNENYIRVLNLSLPRFPDRTLQVGVVVNNEIACSKYVSRASLVLLISIFAVGLLASLFLTSFLLQPLAKLADFISSASDKLKAEQVITSVPENLRRKGSGVERFFRLQDEYQRLVEGFNLFIERINRFHRNSKLWAYQMAHELKTPLTLINLESESLLEVKSPKEQAPKVRSIRFELRKVSEALGSFLNWAELENSTGSKHLFANRIAQVTTSCAQRLDAEGKKIELLIHTDFIVPSSPAHLEQLILNLLTNALKHSGASKVKVQICQNGLCVEDFGPGIPTSVLERLGEPFNKGTDRQGTGLGLAWVNSICKLYSWDLNVTSSPAGTKVLVTFGSH